MLYQKSSITRIYLCSGSLYSRKMKTIAETYRDRLKLLVQELGSKVALADKLERSPSQIGQWVNGSKDSKTGERRSLDKKTARYIEMKTGKPEGWMDQPVRSPFEPPNSVYVHANESELEKQSLTDNSARDDHLDSEILEIREVIALMTNMGRSERLEVLVTALAIEERQQKNAPKQIQSVLVQRIRQAQQDILSEPWSVSESTPSPKPEKLTRIPKSK